MTRDERNDMYVRTDEQIGRDEKLIRAALEMAVAEVENDHFEAAVSIRSIDPAEVLAKVGGCNIDPEVEYETLMADEVARRIGAGDYLVITDDGDTRRQRDIDAAEGADQARALAAGIVAAADNAEGKQ